MSKLNVKHKTILTIKKFRYRFAKIIVKLANGYHDLDGFFLY